MSFFGRSFLSPKKGMRRWTDAALRRQVPWPAMARPEAFVSRVRLSSDQRTTVCGWNARVSSTILVTGPYLLLSLRGEAIALQAALRFVR